VAGLSGEQFALPEAVGALRQVRRTPPDGELLALSASDPLNLAGTVLPGSKVPRLPGARVLYRDGIALAALVAGKFEWLVDPLPVDEREVRRVLLREPGPVETLLARPAAEHRADGDPEAASAEGGARR